MKVIKIVILSICLISIQQYSEAQSRFEFSDIYLFGGAGGTATSPLSNSEINTLESGLVAPGAVSSLTKKSYNKYDYKGRFSGTFGIMAAWNLRNAKRGQQKLRIGFSGGAYKMNWNGYSQNKNTYRIDTLVSQQTGEQYFIDSTHTKSLNYEHLAQMFNLHIDYLYYINPKNKLTMYTGIGASLGVSLSNTVTANYNEYSSVNNMGKNKDQDYYGQGYHQGYNKNDNGEEYTKTLSPTTNINAFAMVGLNWRLSKRNSFFKHVNLFNEMQLGLQLNQMQEINPSIGFNAGVQSGLRISF